MLAFFTWPIRSAEMFLPKYGNSGFKASHYPPTPGHFTGSRSRGWGVCYQRVGSLDKCIPVRWLIWLLCMNSFFKTLYTKQVKCMDGASALTSWLHHVDFLCTKTNCQIPGEWAGLELTEPWRTGSSQKQSNDNNNNIADGCTMISKTQLFYREYGRLMC